MLQTITFQQFDNLTFDDQLDYCMSFYKSLTFKKKQPLVYFIGLACHFLTEQGFMSSSDCSHWFVYRFSMNLSELRETSVELYTSVITLLYKVA